MRVSSVGSRAARGAIGGAEANRCAALASGEQPRFATVCVHVHGGVGGRTEGRSGTHRSRRRARGCGERWPGELAAFTRHAARVFWRVLAAIVGQVVEADAALGAGRDRSGVPNVTRNELVAVARSAFGLGATRVDDVRQRTECFSCAARTLDRDARCIATVTGAPKMAALGVLTGDAHARDASVAHRIARHTFVDLQRAAGKADSRAEYDRQQSEAHSHASSIKRNSVNPGTHGGAGKTLAIEEIRGGGHAPPRNSARRVPTTSARDFTDCVRRCSARLDRRLPRPHRLRRRSRCHVRRAGWRKAQRVDEFRCLAR